MWRSTLIINIHTFFWQLPSSWSSSDWNIAKQIKGSLLELLFIFYWRVVLVVNLWNLVTVGCYFASHWVSSIKHAEADNVRKSASWFSCWRTTRNQMFIVYLQTVQVRVTSVHSQGHHTEELFAVDLPKQLGWGIQGVWEGWYWKCRKKL